MPKIKKKILTMELVPEIQCNFIAEPGCLFVTAEGGLKVVAGSRGGLINYPCYRFVKSEEDPTQLYYKIIDIYEDQ